MIETVTIANPGNPDDVDGYGGVDYVFHIGKYEVTAAQYTAFLNAVAATDPYGLYDEHMWTNERAGSVAMVRPAITRTAWPRIGPTGR